jgi:hypothetical protein
MKLIYKLSFILLLGFSALQASAHGGGLDSDGGHYNHKTGGYHYHRGVRGNMGLLVIAGAATVFFLLKAKSKK